MMRLLWFLTELNTPDSFLLLEIGLFCTLRTQPQTPDQGQGPSRVAKTRIWFQQCYQNLITKDAMFTASLHAILTGYSGVAT